MAYAIRFDFPPANAPCYAGEYKGALGFASTLATAILFNNADEALRTLKNGYGEHVRSCGRVMQVSEHPAR